MDVKNVTKGGVRSKLIAKIIHFRPASGLARNMGKVLIPYSLRTYIRRALSVINRMESPKPEFPGQVRLIMAQYYKDEIAELETMLGRKIIVWEK